MSGLTFNETTIPAVETASNNIYVRKNGNDANDGLSASKAKQTITSAINKAISLGLNANNRIAILVSDSGEYTEDIVVPEFLDIEAPCATLITNNGTAITASPNSNVFFYTVVASGASGLCFLYNSTSSESTFFRAKECTAAGDANIGRFLSGSANFCPERMNIENGIAIDAGPTFGPSPFFNGVKSDFLSAFITGSGTLIRANDANSTVDAGGRIVSSVLSTSKCVQCNNGKVNVTLNAVNMNGGSVWDVSASGEVNFISNNVTRYQTSGEFGTAGKVSAFITDEEIKRFKVQTTGSSQVEVYRLSVEDGGAVGFTVEAIAKRVGDEGSVYQRVISLFEREAGESLERIGGSSGTGIRTTTENQYRIEFDEDGNDAVVYARGRNGHTLNWDIKITENRKDG